jgi:AmmeMemoRadiSam system protein B
MREPISLGAYYDRDRDLLKKEIDAHYFGPRSPGAIPKGNDKNIVACVAPNSPYSHCGDCMAWTYKSIAETPLPDTYVIISANHHSQEAGISKLVFNMPLGLVQPDTAMIDAIVKQGIIEINEEIHARDHGIEVQLPFLQHAKYDEMDKIHIVPIIINEDINLSRLADIIRATATVLKRKIIVIASTDLTHYGPIFHYVPFTTQIPARIYELDDEMLSLVQKNDVEGYTKFVDAHFETKEGLRTIELLMRIVRVPRHYTSGDVLGDFKNSVSYASVLFEKVN